MRKSEGFVLEVLIGLIVVGLLFLLFFTKIHLSEQIVSGIVYNNSNNALLSGNTYFSIRASENTVVTGENQSSYCLPPNSPYIGLVKQAAEDKKIKVKVKTKRVFAVVPSPLTCTDNITVEKVQ